MVVRTSGRGHRRGHKYRVCSVCGKRCVHASRVKARVELRDPEHHARSFDVGAIVCDVCLEANPGKQWQTTPLPVLTEEQRAREKPTQRRTKCRPCGGLGCHVCNGVGRVVVTG